MHKKLRKYLQYRDHKDWCLNELVSLISTNDPSIHNSKFRVLESLCDEIIETNDKLNQLSV